MERQRPGDAADVIAYVIDPPGEDEVDQEMTWEFTLALTDEPWPRADVAAHMQHWLTNIAGWVIPQVFQRAEAT